MIDKSEAFPSYLDDDMDEKGNVSKWTNESQTLKNNLLDDCCELGENHGGIIHIPSIGRLWQS